MYVWNAFPQSTGSCWDLASPTRGRIVAAITCSFSAGRTLPLQNLAGKAHNDNKNNGKRWAHFHMTDAASGFINNNYLNTSSHCN